MGNPLLELQPNKVSRDIGSYITYIYGSPKCGKSRFAAEFPSALFITTEPTNRAIPGIVSQEVENWAAIKKTLRFLKDDEVKKRFKTIIIDTVDLAADFCEQYICSQNNVDKIADIPWGAGYGMVEKEFEKVIRQIRQEHYGLVLISHVKDGTFTRDDGTEYNKVIPAISSKKCLAVAENFADIYGWAHVKQNEKGETKTVLTLRQENDSVSGGNHFKYLQSEIELSYAALEAAINRAFDLEENEVGGDMFTDERKDIAIVSYDFNALHEEFDSLVQMISDNVPEDDWQNVWGPKITHIVEANLGRGKRVADLTPSQAEQLDVIISDLKDEVGKGL